MKRNAALGLGAWISTLIVANATQIGQLLENNANYIVATYRMGRSVSNVEYLAYLAQNSGTTDAAYGIVFLFLTVIAIMVGRIFVVLWGEPDEGVPSFSVMPAETVRKVGLDAVSAALAPSR